MGMASLLNMARFPFNSIDLKEIPKPSGMGFVRVWMCVWVWGCHWEVCVCVCVGGGRSLGGVCVGMSLGSVGVGMVGGWMSGEGWCEPSCMCKYEWCLYYPHS